MLESARKCTKISTKISNCIENQITTFKMLDLWKFWKLWIAACISINTYGIRDLHSKTGRFGRIITDRTGSEVKIKVKFRCPGRSRPDQNWAKFWYRAETNSWIPVKTQLNRMVRGSLHAIPSSQKKLSSYAPHCNRENLYFKKYFSDSLEIQN